MTGPGYPLDRITGVILAGGRGQRMGGEDKGLVELVGEPLVAHALRQLRPQVAGLIINANRNRQRYAALGDCEVIEDLADRQGDFAGPLAGMLSAMRAASTQFILTVPCDSPLVSDRLAERLYAALIDDDAELSVAHDGQRLQPVFALIDCALADSMASYLDEGERKIDGWFTRHRMAQADLSDQSDTFLNVNTPEEREALERRLAGNPAAESS